MAQSNSAVFIRSKKPFCDIIGACQELLSKLEGDAKIVGFMEASQHGGYKMYFNDDAVVPLLLGKRYLIENDESTTIHPLTTRLTVRKVFPRSDDVFRREVQDTLQSLGPVLNIFKIPFSDALPDIGSGDWRVVLDVPEVSDLEMFEKFGLPDDMLIKLPSIDEHLNVKFHCIRCNQDSHTQFECESEFDATSNPKEAEWSANNKSRRVPEVRLELLNSKKNELESTTVTPTDLLKIKKEILDYEASDEGPSSKMPRLSNYDDNAVYNPEVRSSNDGCQSYLNSDSAHALVPRGSAEDSVTTTKPEATTEVVKTEYFDDNECEESRKKSFYRPRNAQHYGDYFSSDENESQGSKKKKTPSFYRKRKKPTLDQPITIPERIRSIIDRLNGPLDADRMEAFFTHTKKKSRPCDMAKIFCEDVASLKNQLQTVQTQYYETNAAPRKEEREFMKWFVGMLQRFDGPVCATRKRS